MQMVVWVLILFFTEKTNTTMASAVRQADYSDLAAIAGVWGTGSFAQEPIRRCKIFRRANPGYI